MNPSLCLDEQDLETCHNQALILLFNFFKKMTGYKNNVACFRPEDCKRKRAKDRPCFVKLLRSTRLNSCFHTCVNLILNAFLSIGRDEMTNDLPWFHEILLLAEFAYKMRFSAEMLRFDEFFEFAK